MHKSRTISPHDCVLPVTSHTFIELCAPLCTKKHWFLWWICSDCVQGCSQLMDATSSERKDVFGCSKITCSSNKNRVFNLTWITVATCWENMSNNFMSAGIPGPSSRCANKANLKFAKIIQKHKHYISLNVRTLQNNLRFIWPLKYSHCSNLDISKAN